MGQADYLRVGDWNIRCDRCGKKMKGSEARLTWNNLYTCDSCWEPRHPQDFVRSIVEHPTPAFVRDPPDIGLPFADGIVLEDSFGPLPDTTGPFDLERILLETGDWIIAES